MFIVFLKMPILNLSHSDFKVNGKNYEERENTVCKNLLTLPLR